MKKMKPTPEELHEKVLSGEIIEEYKGLVVSIATRLNKLHPNENLQELIAEGYWGIFTWIEDFDPKKSSINSWAYKCAWGPMKTLCTKPKLHDMIPHEPASMVFEQPINSEPWLMSFFRELGEDAYLLARVALEAPGELSQIIQENNRRESRKAIKVHMKNTHNWDKSRLESAWQEIAECL
jgi:hypothetical protein